MVSGVKSKFFGCFWESMFLTALTYPDKADPVKHSQKIKQFKQFYNSFKYIIPCRFCREFTANVLEKKFPIDFSGKRQLLFSLYIWKDTVNKKLIAQGCDKTKPSPPFESVVKRLNKLSAKCDKSVGKCI